MLFSTVITAARCGDTRVRKEIRDMSREEWTAYKAAIKSMQADGSYQSLAQIHVDIFQQIHGGYNFAQWHRIYLCKFEDEVRKHSSISDIGIPYYAAWEDSARYGANSIDNSPVFTEQYFGAGKGKCVKADNNTIFTSATTNIGGTHCISRQFDHTRGISQRASIQHLETGTSNFKQFSDLLQVGYHAETHLFIAGDMAQHHSVNDPIFFSHHASVDQIYDQFQASKKDFDANSIPENSAKAAMFPEYTYGDAHANKVCCADYQAYSGSQGFGNPTPTNPPNATATGTNTTVQNTPASADALANLGIPADKVDKQNDWNGFKSAFAKGQGASFVQNLLNNNSTGSTKGKPSSSTTQILSSSVLAIAVLCFLG